MTWEPDYITLPEVKDYIDDDGDDVAGDALLAINITTASRAVDGWCNRQFGSAGEEQARTYPGVYDRYCCFWVYEIDDLYDTAGLTAVDADGNDVTDLTFWPRNAIVNGIPVTQVRSATGGELTFTSDSWGWAAVPAPVKNATLIQTARLSKRKDSPFGVAGSPANGGSELRLLAQLDPDVRTSLPAKYRREVWAL